MNKQWDGVEEKQADGLPEGWKKVKLEEVCVPKEGVQTGPFGSQLHQKDYVILGTPIITVEHLQDNRISNQNLPYVSDEDKKRLKKYTLKKGDIVFSRVGSVDRRALVREKEDGWMFSGRCLRVRLSEDKASSEFVSFQFGLESFKEYIRSVAVGATMPSINTKILSESEIILPPLPEQKAIAAILGALDDKIEANRRTNATLEGIARALFKSWFVDFDPVHAKAEGRPSGLPADLDALFSTSFTDSPQGEIPTGWKVGRLSDVLELAYGKALRSIDRNEGNIPVYGSGGITGYHSEPLVAGPGIIIGRKGTVGSIHWESRDFFPIDTVFYVIPKHGIPLAYLYCLVQTLGLSEMNTDAAVPGLNRENAYRLNVNIPPALLLEKAEGVLNGLQNKIDANDTQNQTLATLRDTLLPKLISGQIRVKDAEKLVENAI